MMRESKEPMVSVELKEAKQGTTPSLNPTLPRWQRPIKWFLGLRVTKAIIGDFVEDYFFPGRPNIKDANGTTISTLGNPRLGLGVNIVELSPKSPAVMSIAKQVASLNELDSRRPYRPIQLATKSVFSLAMDDRSSLSHRKEFMKFLYDNAHAKDHEYCLVQLDSKIDRIFAELDRDAKANPKEIIEKHITDFVTNILLGVDLNKKMRNLLQEMHALETNFPAVILSTIAPRLLNLYPAFRKMRQHYKQCSKEFIHEQIRYFAQDKKEEVAGVTGSNNFLHKLLCRKMPQDKNFSTLTAKEIDALTVDPEIGMCITGLLATNNLSSFLSRSSEYLLNSSTGLDYYVNYAFEDDRFSPEDIDTRPLYKDAVYLELLRWFAPMPVMLRYTEKALTIEGIHIPARSIISLHVDKILKANAGGACPTPLDEFYPYRYLWDSSQNAVGDWDPLSIHKQAELLSMLSHGAGIRRCPAHSLNKMVTLRLLDRLAQRRQDEKARNQHAVSVAMAAASLLESKERASLPPPVVSSFEPMPDFFVWSAPSSAGLFSAASTSVSSGPDSAEGLTHSGTGFSTASASAASSPDSAEGLTHSGTGLSTASASAASGPDSAEGLTHSGTGLSTASAASDSEVAERLTLSSTGFSRVSA